jgi:hypothetical protein
MTDLDWVIIRASLNVIQCTRCGVKSPFSITGRPVTDVATEALAWAEKHRECKP